MFENQSVNSLKSTMRLQTKMQWLCVSIFLTILVSGSLILRQEDQEFSKTTSTPIKGALSLAHSKHVTKSLAQLDRMDEVNKHLLFLNYIPKCGSEILILLLQKLQGYNNYRHVRLKGGNRRHLTNLQQEHLIDEIYDLMQKQAVPISVDRNVFFVDFKLFDKQFPTYINLIRHPVNKFFSRSRKSINEDPFHRCLISKRNDCNFKSGQPYDLSIPYFCGHDPRCMILNNEWALQEAKNNVISYYPVVGVLEELNVTLEILEYKVPYFFKGVRSIFVENLSHLRNDKPVKAPKSVIRKLEEILTNEIIFYEFIRSRLFKQLQILYGDNSHH